MGKILKDYTYVLKVYMQKGGFAQVEMDKSLFSSGVLNDCEPIVYRYLMEEYPTWKRAVFTVLSRTDHCTHRRQILLENSENLKVMFGKC